MPSIPPILLGLIFVAALSSNTKAASTPTHHTESRLTTAPSSPHHILQKGQTAVHVSMPIMLGTTRTTYETIHIFEEGGKSLINSHIDSNNDVEITPAEGLKLRPVLSEKNGTIVIHTTAR